MSEPRQQHVVPAFYLRRFADATGRVAAYDLTTGALRLVAVRRFLTETHRNTLWSESGDPDFDIELQLGQLEGATAAVLKRMAGRPLLPAAVDEVLLLQNFVAAQLSRGFRAGRVVTRGVEDATHRRVLQRLAEDRPDLAAGSPVFTVALVGNERVLAPWRHFYERARRELASLDHVRLDAVGRPAFTSDEPIQLHLRHGAIDGASLTIDPRHVLSLSSSRSPLRHGECDAVAGAERWVISHPDDQGALVEACDVHFDCWERRQ